MKKQLLEQFENLRPALINAIKETVAFPSVLDENATDTPFGKEIDDCLKHTLKMCDSLGFNTFYNEEGYYGYAEIGSGKEMLAILGHLDVVPAGDLNKWDSNPFEVLEKDNKLFGRGTQDDKGPTLIALYAVKALMDTGVTFNRRIRFIFGTDEENLWRGINKYMENEEIPTMGFTPDSKFPLIYAEKGLLQFTFVGEGEPLILKGGDSYNAVPDLITYTSKDIPVIEKELKKINGTFDTKDNIITVFGKSVHAASGEDGINAIKKLMIAISNTGLSTPSLNFVSEYLGDDPYAEKIFGQLEDEMSGKLKFNLGKVDINNEKSILHFDVRIPVSFSKEEIVEKLEIIASKFGFKYEERDFLKSLYVPLDNLLIKSLIKVYEEETDFDSTPLSSGGATYARSMENCVAFGPVFPDSKKTEHQPNENLSLEDLDRAFIIYGKAVYELTR